LLFSELYFIGWFSSVSSTYSRRESVGLIL